MTDSEVKKLMCMPHTDEGNAERLRYMFGKTWKYLPRYKSWLHWDGHSWKGQTTTDLRRAITDAFQQLALAIYALPVTADEMQEKERRLMNIAWLYKSQVDWHVTLAVRYYKKMLWREDAAE